MNLVRAALPDASVIVGAIQGAAIVDLSSELRALDEMVDPMLTLLQLSAARRQELVESATRAANHVSLQEVHLLSPVQGPGKVLAVARGYARQQEPSITSDATPYLFLKRSDDILGPTDPIPVGPPATAVVAEIEIGIVIGRRARSVSIEAAVDSITGYTIGNDVSARGLDLAPPGRRDAGLDGFLDWLNGKWLDGFLVLGPAIVTRDEWPDGKNRQLVTRISGAETVTGNTSQLLHGFGEIVAFASRLMTLQPGDVILTGMPETPKPERLLAAGDLVEGEVDGLGLLRNPVVHGSSVSA